MNATVGQRAERSLTLTPAHVTTFAQLTGDYCAWPRSREQAPCAEEPINRSAFVSWVDCRL